MKFEGKIKELNQIIVSDPSYDEEVTCRYERKNVNQKDMNVIVEIHECSDKYDEITINGVEFFILIHNPKEKCELKENGNFTYPKRNQVTRFDIGIDTACISLGINNFADDIREAREEWQPPFALNTLSDGLFGVVKEGKKDDKINFIFISGYLSEDTGYSIEDVVDCISTYLEVTDLYKEINGIKFPIVDSDKDITDDMF